MKALYAVAASLLLTPSLWGQTPPAPPAPPSVVMPAEVKVEVGRLASVQIAYSGDDLRYDVPPDLDAFREYDPNPKVWRLRLIGYAPGRYRLLAVTCSGGKLSDFTACTITVGQPVPPVPPGPTPPTPGGGLTALITYETADLGKLPRAQEQVLFAKPVRDYLNAKGADDPAGNGQKAWRIWDQNTDASAENKLWQDLMKRERKALPWLYLSNGRDVFEGPLPASVEEVLGLMKKYGG